MEFNSAICGQMKHKLCLQASYIMFIFGAKLMESLRNGKIIWTR